MLNPPPPVLALRHAVYRAVKKNGERHEKEHASARPAKSKPDKVRDLEDQQADVISGPESFMLLQVSIAACITVKTRCLGRIMLGELAQDRFLLCLRKPFSVP